MLLSLPAELKLEIATLLIASLYLKDARAQTLASHPSDSFRDLSNLAMTCKGWRDTCYKLLIQGARLAGEENHKRFLVDLDSGRLSAAASSEKKIKFLSFGNPAYCDNCGSSWLDYVHGHDRTIKRIVTHFSESITILELVDYPFNIYNFQVLTTLRNLTTLYVLNPDPRQHAIMMLRKRTSRWTIPQLERLSIVIKDFQGAEQASNILHFFERSLISFSLSSEEKCKLSMPADSDCLGPGAVFLANPTNAVCLLNLRHLHIGYLPIKASSLRETIGNLTNLESFTVDCRGVKPDGTLPLFYALDMLSMSIDPSEDMRDLISWEYILRGWDKDAEMWDDNWMRNPYVDEAEVWRRPLAGLTFAFGPADRARGLRKTAEELQLTFASCDADRTPVNVDMHFHELAEVFQRRAAMLSALKSLSIRVADEEDFDSKESQLELEETAFSLVRHNLPSLEWLDVSWGHVRIASNPSKTAANLSEK